VNWGLYYLNDIIILRTIYVNLRRVAVRVAGLSQPLSERPDYGGRSSALPSGEEICPNCGKPCSIDCECDKQQSEMYLQK
jgi:hypothetical protein